MWHCWLLVWLILLLLLLEFFHIGSQRLSVLQCYSIVQGGTNSSNWPAGGDTSSYLRVWVGGLRTYFWMILLVQQFRVQSIYRNSWHPNNSAIDTTKLNRRLSVSNLCPFRDIIPRLAAPSRNFFSNPSSPLFFPTRNGIFMRLRHASSTGHLDMLKQQ